jgi:hypothetical protein
MAIFNSYVKLPEGTVFLSCGKANNKKNPIEPEICEISAISSELFEAMDDQQFLRGRSPRRSYGSDIARRFFFAFLGRGFLGGFLDVMILRMEGWSCQF